MSTYSILNLSVPLFFFLDTRSNCRIFTNGGLKWEENVKYTLKTRTTPTTMCNGIQRKDGCVTCALSDRTNTKRMIKHASGPTATYKVRRKWLSLGISRFYWLMKLKTSVLAGTISNRHGSQGLHTVISTRAKVWLSLRQAYINKGR